MVIPQVLLFDDMQKRIFSDWSWFKLVADPVLLTDPFFRIDKLQALDFSVLHIHASFISKEHWMIMRAVMVDPGSCKKVNDYLVHVLLTQGASVGILQDPMEMV